MTVEQKFVGTVDSLTACGAIVALQVKNSSIQGPDHSPMFYVPTLNIILKSRIHFHFWIGREVLLHI